MAFDTIYIILAVFIFGLNVVPAFMPPTWILLAFFYIHFHLSFIATVFIGASFATLGRIVLYLLAKTYFRQFFSKQTLQNYATLGAFFKKHQNVSIPLIIIYAFFPIPSNDIYIVAGLSNAPITILALSFFIGRLMSYSFWVNLTYHFSNNIQDIFKQYLSKGNVFVGEIIGLLFVIAIGKIPWKKILKIKS